ncbi:MAG: L-lactate permease [Candidatus Heimdallarchaeaceae archaeon]
MSLLLDVFLILIPFLIGIVLLIWLKLKADVVGLILFVLLSVIAIFYFQTDWRVALLSSLAGIIKSFPISLMVLTSILMMTYMEKTGALAKIVVSFKKIGGGNKAFQIMVINLAMGTFLVSIGATPVTMLPPVLAAMGYSAFVSVSLPAIGYDPLCTYALLAVPAVVFADFMGITLESAGLNFSFYMPLVTLGIALGMLWLAGGKKLLFSKNGLTFSIVGGLTAGSAAIVSNLLGLVTLTGVFSGIITASVLVLVAYIKKIKIIDPSVLTEEERKIDKSMSLWRALSPWIFLIIFVSITNLVPFFVTLFSVTVALPIKIGYIEVATKIFAQAYFWVLIATLCSIPLLGFGKGEKTTYQKINRTLQLWLKRSYRPVFAAAIFFAAAFLIMFSGYVTNGDINTWEKVLSHNMINQLAIASANAFGKFYPLIVPFIGLFGGFISGSETSSIAMFTLYHKQTALNLGISAIAVGTANGVGGGLASVLSPAKIQNAAAVIDQVGIEGEVIKKTAPIAFLMTLSVAAICLSWANNYPWWGWLIVFTILFSILGIVGVFIFLKKDKTKGKENKT